MVTSYAELAKEVNENRDEIEVSFEIFGVVIKIKGIGVVAWAIAIGAIGVAVVAVLATGGAGAPVSAAILAPTAAIIGVPTATACIGIAVAAGGVGVLSTLRNYKPVERNGRYFLVKE